MVGFFIGMLLGALCGIGVANFLCGSEDGELEDAYKKKYEQYEAVKKQYIACYKDYQALSIENGRLRDERHRILSKAVEMRDGLTYKQLGNKKILDEIIGQFDGAEGK